jgi:hypothetical protein
MENLPITIKLTLAQWNLVLNALGQRPFAEVNEIITAIKVQGEQIVAEAKDAIDGTEPEGAA